LITGRGVGQLERARWLRHQDVDERGYVLILVMAIAVIILSLSAVAVKYSVVDLGATGTYTNAVQARLAAETGLNVALSQIDAATSLGSLPCPNPLTTDSVTTNLAVTAPTTPPTPTYANTVSYVATFTSTTPITPTPTACTTAPTTWPGMAEIRSVGTMAGTTSVMVEDIQITAPVAAATNTAFSDAIYSPTSVGLVTSTINKGTNSAANVVTGGPIGCSNNVAIQGSLISYSTAISTFNNGCSVTGDLDLAATYTQQSNVNGVSVGGNVLDTSSGGLYLSSVPVTGNVYSAGPYGQYGSSTGGSLYATNAVTLNSTTVNGSAYATGGFNLQSSATIKGSAYSGSGGITMNTAAINGSAASYASSAGINITASGTIGSNGTGSALATGSNSQIQVQGGTSSIAGGAHASGAISYNVPGTNQTWLGTITGAPGSVTANDSSITNTTMPTSLVPVIPAMPTAPTWPQITTPTQAAWAAKGYTNYVVVTQAQCAAGYFYYTSGSTPFLNAVNSETTPTVFDASACSDATNSEVNLDGPSNSETFSLKTDIALVVNGAHTSGTNIFQSSSPSTPHNFSLIVPYPDTGNVKLSNLTQFASSLSTFIYVGQGAMDVNSSPGLTGQILSYGAFTASSGSSFAETFSTAAALTIPGVVTAAGGSGSASISPVRRYSSR
jgi:hypothetical protein